MDKKKSGFLLFVLGAIALTAFMFVAIPPMIRRISNAVYKLTLRFDTPDIGEMGPVIERKRQRAGE